MQLFGSAQLKIQFRNCFLFPLLQFEVQRVVADEEAVPFAAQSADLLLSSLAAHWINDLPGWFRRCHDVLRPDGAMIGCTLAGETLHELRVALQLAELERLGGIGAHVSPFVQPQDIGGLMQRAGFDMITLDLDDIEVGLGFRLTKSKVVLVSKELCLSSLHALLV